ncbi:hypothetical protein [Aureimonas sp. N4]|uniref:hypothetical protein n=1 Tax=Aureimonas sp. N4 TaxID=1638165 RepID=UPI0007850DF9|nr:hypothetical protein [Aureimonas sp. N4]
MDAQIPQLLVLTSFALRATVPLVVRTAIGLDGIVRMRRRRAAKIIAQPVTNPWFFGTWIGQRLGDAISIGVLIWGGFF